MEGEFASQPDRVGSVGRESDRSGASQRLLGRIRSDASSTHAAREYDARTSTARPEIVRVWCESYPIATPACLAQGRVATAFHLDNARSGAGGN